MQHGTAGLVTHLTDAVEPRPEEAGGLRVGHEVLLRRRGDGRTVEAWSARLGRIGCLPPEAVAAVAPLLGGRPSTLAATVSALVPRPGPPGGTRIHIRLSGEAG
jgi:hypothetical protein